jgi:hypothetical protein
VDPLNRYNRGVSKSWCLAFAILALSIAGCATGPRVAQPDDSRLTPQVRALLDPATRDAAFLDLMRRLEFDEGFGPKAEPDESLEIMHVVRCPQFEGSDMVAVFTDRVEPATAGRPWGHIVLFRPDGTTVAFWEGANCLEEDSEFRDLNADGIVDAADVCPCGHKVDYWELFVVPVTPAQRATLRVWWKEEHWTWEAVDPDGDGLFEIRVGPMVDGRIEPAAIYRWSLETEAWVGPAGSANGTFLRPESDGEGPDADAFYAALLEDGIG